MMKKSLIMVLILILYSSLAIAADKSWDGVDVKLLKRADHIPLKIIRDNKKIRFSWERVGNADFYRIYAAETMQGFDFSAGKAIVEIPAGQHSITIDNAAKYEGYFFVITAVNKTGESDQSAYLQQNSYNQRVFGGVMDADIPGACVDSYFNAGEADINKEADTVSLNTYTFPINVSANRIIMKWDVRNIPPGVKIKRATLYLYAYESGGDTAYELSVHRIINHNPDMAFCTWNTYDGTNPWTGGNDGGAQDLAPADSSTVVDTTLGYKYFDITKMVQTWVNDPTINYGMMIDSDDSAAADSHRYFRPTNYSNANQRPKLVVEYLYQLDN